jgi:hypothetical protein
MRRRLLQRKELFTFHIVRSFWTFELGTLDFVWTRIMKNRTLTNDQRGLTRRQLLGLATLTGAGLAAGSIGPPETNAALA